jgi:GxxExxY protein
MIELRRSGLSFDYIKQLAVEYSGQFLGYQDVRLILVEDKILLTVFALRWDAEAAMEQLKVYLRRLEIKLGLVANFYGTELSLTIVRVG